MSVLIYLSLLFNNALNIFLINGYIGIEIFLFEKKISVSLTGIRPQINHTSSAHYQWSTEVS